MNYIIVVSLMVMSYFDIRKGVVSNFLYIPLLFFIKFKIIVVLLFIIMVYFYSYLEKYIGGADIKISFIFLLIYPYTFVLNWLCIASLIALLYSIILKFKEIRFFPFLLISYLILVWYEEVLI